VKSINSDNSRYTSVRLCTYIFSLQSKGRDNK